MLRYLRRANLFAVFLCTYLSVAIGAPPVIWGPNSSVQTLTQRGLLVGDQLQQSGNLVLNPSAFKGTSSVTTSNATATRSTTSPISISGVAEWNVTITSANGTVTWSSAPSAQWEGLKGQNCEARFRFRGFQTTTVFQVVAGSNVLGQLSPATISTTNAQTGSINFPCGDMTNVPQFRVTDTATLSGTNELAEIYIGAPTNMADVNVITNWRSYTSTATNFTFSTQSFQWRRIGDSIQINGYFLSTAAPTGTILVSIPGGLTIDTNKTGISDLRALGTAQLYPGVASTSYTGTVYPATTTTLAFQGPSSATWNASNPVSITNPFIVGFSVTLPISNWNAELAVTPSQAARSIARYTRGTAQSIPNTTATIVNYSTQTFDLNSEVTTGASWKFTAKNAGYYQVSAALMFDSSSSWAVGSKSGQLDLWKNGTQYSIGDRVDFLPAGTGVYAKFLLNDSIYLNAGDYIDIRVTQLTGGSLNTFADSTHNYVNIQRIDPASNSAVYVQGPVRGANTGDTIPTGYVGEVISATQGTASVGATGTYFDAVTLTLPTGIWEVSGYFTLVRNGATFSFVKQELAFITASGNSIVGGVENNNYQIFTDGGIATGFTTHAFSLLNVRVISDGTNLTVAGSQTAGTTIRFKALTHSYSVATPSYRAFIKAIRIN